MVEPIKKRIVTSLEGKPCIECSLPLVGRTNYICNTPVLMYYCSNCRVDFTIDMYMNILRQLNMAYMNTIGMEYMPEDELFKDTDSPIIDNSIQLGKDDLPEDEIPNEIKILLKESEALQKEHEEMIATFEKEIEEV